MSMENINGKLFVEESYPIGDISHGVVSKGMVVRHYEKLNAKYLVVAVSSFKVDHQDESVTIRIQVKPRTSEKRVVLPDDNQKPVALTVDPEYCGLDEKPVALLNPGYDELLLENKGLKEEIQQLKINAGECDASSID